MAHLNVLLCFCIAKRQRAQRHAQCVKKASIPFAAGHLQGGPIPILVHDPDPKLGLVIKRKRGRTMLIVGGLVMCALILFLLALFLFMARPFDAVAHFVEMAMTAC